MTSENLRNLALCIYEKFVFHLKQCPGWDRKHIDDSGAKSQPVAVVRGGVCAVEGHGLWA